MEEEGETLTRGEGEHSYVIFKDMVLNWGQREDEYNGIADKLKEEKFLKRLRLRNVPNAIVWELCLAGIVRPLCQR